MKTAKIESFKFIKPTPVNSSVRWALGLSERATLAKVYFADGNIHWKVMGV